MRVDCKTKVCDFVAGHKNGFAEANRITQRDEGVACNENSSLGTSKVGPLYRKGAVRGRSRVCRKTQLANVAVVNIEGTRNALGAEKM